MLWSHIHIIRWTLGAKLKKMHYTRMRFELNRKCSKPSIRKRRKLLLKSSSNPNLNLHKKPYFWKSRGAFLSTLNNCSYVISAYYEFWLFYYSFKSDSFTKFSFLQGLLLCFGSWQKLASVKLLHAYSLCNLCG